MSYTPEPNPSGDPSAAPGVRSSRPKPSVGRDLLVISLLLAGLAGGMTVWLYTVYLHPVEAVKVPQLIRAGVVNPSQLAGTFKDADGDLVADPPSDPAQQIDPEVLLFGLLGDEGERRPETWKEFVDHLSKTTGKKVKLVEASAGGKEVCDQIEARKLHLLNVSTGTVPRAVNEGGFVPMCVMANADGKFQYEMEILVPAGSPAQSPKDLKGSTLGLTSFSSLSSFKAPILTLWKDHQLLIGRDYDFIIYAGQEAAIHKVADGAVPAVAVANDLLRRIVVRDEIDPRSFRSIYKSESFPPTCFGYVHDLKPELAKKVREAFLGFDWKGTGLEKSYKPANQTKFVPVSYKEDWKRVRELDEAIAKMLEKP
jgi:phosphonate transport system substrate-binding protein